MKVWKLHSAVVALVLGVLSNAPAQAATTTYSYEGNPFDLVDPGLANVTFVSASLTVPDRIAPNTTAFFDFVSGSPPPSTEFSVADGVTTVTEQDVGDYDVTFTLFTDDNGGVDEWGIFVQRSGGLSPGHQSIGTFWAPSIPSAQLEDRTTYCISEPAGGSCIIREAEIQNNPGSWSIIPIPAAAWLFGSALGLLVWVRRNTACPPNIRHHEARPSRRAFLCRLKAATD